MPAFLRAMTTPSKAWTRSRVPSSTLTLTRTVSPGPKTGTGAVPTYFPLCSCSPVSPPAIDTPQRRRLAARQHIIADRDLFQPALVDDALVDPLIAPAQERDAGQGCEIAHPLLVEQLATRRQIDQRMPLALRRSERRID